jgi:hypothetical protein
MSADAVAYDHAAEVHRIALDMCEYLEAVEVYGEEEDGEVFEPLEVRVEGWREPYRDTFHANAVRLLMSYGGPNTWALIDGEGRLEVSCHWSEVRTVRGTASDSLASWVLDMLLEADGSGSWGRA